jgi:C1A family cysteine protease
MVKNNNQKHFYGWIKDTPDKRDKTFESLGVTVIGALPTNVDLRKNMPLVYNQGNLGSCTANAIPAAFDFCRWHENKSFIYPSRLFLYYNERKMEGTVDTDSGAQIRDGIKSVGKQGDVPEGQWPYDIALFTEKPPKAIYKNALQYKAVNYARVLDTDINQIKTALATGFPFVFGFNVYASFESPEVAKTGIMPMPQSGEQLLGGHAVCAVGYDDFKQVVIVRNSWGSEWGDQGYFYMPYEYMVSDQTSDFWTIRAVL